MINEIEINSFLSLGLSSLMVLIKFIDVGHGAGLEMKGRRGEDIQWMSSNHHNLLRFSDNFIAVGLKMAEQLIKVNQ